MFNKEVNRRISIAQQDMYDRTSELQYQVNTLQKQLNALLDHLNLEMDRTIVEWKVRPK